MLKRKLRKLKFYLHLGFTYIYRNASYFFVEILVNFQLLFYLASIWKSENLKNWKSENLKNWKSENLKDNTPWNIKFIVSSCTSKISEHIFIHRGSQTVVPKVTLPKNWNLDLFRVYLNNVQFTDKLMCFFVFKILMLDRLNHKTCQIL